MSAYAMSGDWIAAYLDWGQWGAEGLRTIAQAPIAAEGIAEALACSSEEAAAAYLEWIAPAPAAETLSRALDSARRAPPPDDTGTLDALRESMLLTALRTEADYLHILRRVMDAGEAALPARKLVVDALTQAEKLLEEEQRAWSALRGLRNGELREARAEREGDLLAGWPLALEGVAAEVHALAGRLLDLQVH
jgi:hypothetical protein